MCNHLLMTASRIDRARGIFRKDATFVRAADDSVHRDPVRSMISTTLRSPFLRVPLFDALSTYHVGLFSALNCTPCAARANINSRPWASGNVPTLMAGYHDVGILAFLSGLVCLDILKEPRTRTKCTKPSSPRALFYADEDRRCWFLDHTVARPPDVACCTLHAVYSRHVCEQRLLI